MTGSSMKATTPLCRVYQAACLHRMPRSDRSSNMLLQWSILLIFLLLPWLCLGKICTNTGASLSHTLRSQFLAGLDSAAAISGPSGWNFTDQLWGFDARRVILERQSSDKSSFLQPLSLHDVRLWPESGYGVAQQTNLEYLLMLDVDNLVYSFRTTAGLNAAGSPYQGWELPSSELRGHFVGHYLSATALAWASTKNLTIYKNMNAVVAALAECQAKIGTGYLSAFPTSLFDRFEELQSVWAPYYTIHKIMAGLLDQYIYADNQLAFQMLLQMADYFAARVDAVIAKNTIERHWQSLNEETGGMNDVMYRLYQITENDKHVKLAHLFDKPCFLGMLAVQADSISGFHANTHIPVVVGAQMRYETVGDTVFKELTEFFMKSVTSSHMYATGGTSYGEFWTDPNRLGDTLGQENQESCTTYNMLKVARNLFRWSKEMQYADYYERALLNGVLTIQRGQEPGVMIYMLPLAAGSSKAVSYHGWGAPYTSFWCCYGTAIESFAKLGDSIYFQEQGEVPLLYVIQYVSSTASWEAAGLVIDQNVQQITSVNPILNVTFTFTQKQSLGKSTISVRVPYWSSSKGSRCSLNSVDESEAPVPGTFYTITKAWQTGDTLSFSFPAMLRLERLQDETSHYSSLHAIYYGPHLLAGMSTGDYDLGSVNTSSPSDWIVPVHGNLFSFIQRKGAEAQVMALDSNGGLSMINVPADGSKEAPHATFRAILPPSSPLESSSLTVADFSASLVHQKISLELMSRPGKYVSQDHADNSISMRAGKNRSSVFKLVPGLAGIPSTVSFEANGMRGCFLSSTGNSSRNKVSLKCNHDARFDPAAASFEVITGVTSYHPMSFAAFGVSRTYLLFPLTAYKDEQYAVYFNITA